MDVVSVCEEFTNALVGHFEEKVDYEHLGGR
jgi:hypothetical protein